VDERIRWEMPEPVTSTLHVNLAERGYSICFGSDLTAQIRADVAELHHSGRKVVVITDRAVAAAQAGFLKAAFGDTPRFEVDPGESAKSPQVLAEIWNFLATGRVDRGGVVFAVGGGVVGDLAGFAAASWLRGIDFNQVPTTLLAMVDSSVGGKTGINIAAGKNLVGAFHQPRAVFVSTGLLRTLPPREFAAGMAEVIKYGLLGDADLFAQLERTPLTVQSGELAEVIRRCCAAKAKIVEADERELAKEGGRALLNLGHTFGHAIEQVAGYGSYLHGEAVAIGLCAAARLSHKLGTLSRQDAERVAAVVAAHQLPTALRAPLKLDDLFSAMARDKKVRAGVLRFVTLNRIGEAVTREGVPAQLAEDAFREVGAA
jgi:3-dehydroquinate synthase